MNNSVLLQASGIGESHLGFGLFSIDYIDNSVTKQEKPAAKRRAQDVESDVSRTDDESISSKEEEEVRSPSSERNTIYTVNTCKRINKGLKVTEDFRKTSSRNPFETKDTKPKKKRKNVRSLPPPRKNSIFN